jgi:hypothetical protein
MLDIVFILYNLKLIYLDLNWNNIYWINILNNIYIYIYIYIYFSRNLENRVSENLRTVKAVWF